MAKGAVIRFISEGAEEIVGGGGGVTNKSKYSEGYIV